MPSVQRLCLGIGLLFGAAGSVWILGTHRDAPAALQYHVPLAVVFVTFAASAVREIPRDLRWRFWSVTVVALLFVAARLRWDWPISGHGILGAYVMFLAPWTWLRVAGALVLPHAALSKFFMETDVMAIPIGAVLGGVLARVAVPRPGAGGSGTGD